MTVRGHQLHHIAEHGERMQHSRIDQFWANALARYRLWRKIWSNTEHAVKRCAYAQSVRVWTNLLKVLRIRYFTFNKSDVGLQSIVSIPILFKLCRAYTERKICLNLFGRKKICTQRTLCGVHKWYSKSVNLMNLQNINLSFSVIRVFKIIKYYCNI